MGRKAAKPERGAKVATRQRPGSSRAAPDKIIGGNTKPQTRPPSRSIVMRLAAEVDALAEQLKDSRARIQDLETLVDVDPLTDTLNPRTS
jgi:hypothetical protein